MTRQKRPHGSPEEDAALFRALLDSTSEGVLVCDAGGRVLQANEVAHSIFGRTQGGMVGASLDELAPGSLPGDAIEEISEFLADPEGRLELPVLEPTRHRSGRAVVGLQFRRVVGPYRARALVLVRDVTARAGDDGSPRELARERQRVREEERQRLARELHDDFVQRLVLLGMHVELLSRGAPTATSEEVTNTSLQATIAAMKEQVATLVEAARDLSHRLPSAAEVIGLSEALRRDCEAISRARDLRIECSIPELPSTMTPETSAGLYRIAQEALHNAVKHAGSKRVRVELRYKDGRLALEVRDFGRGFDPTPTRNGLGLTHMTERARELGGTLILRSSPGKGTTVTATVPAVEGGSAGES